MRTLWHGPSETDWVPLVEVRKLRPAVYSRRRCRVNRPKQAMAAALPKLPPAASSCVTCDLDDARLGVSTER